ncbi:metallophosphatase family protein [Salinarchaeum sp. IM2453]|uniref:metallophosphoesterase family protein n=1 Tax=Salinarchaeum sp. IM2453 TaxID=2862870 RepID=UPI001C835521|nr:metallophosphoesterase family protein [Salinarchaeum sp. IM2453]QZA89474.1 metallophosphatase family protein [Salinarchaeum sp. IM2453]
MRVGVVSDIHSNKPALDAVLADMPDVELLVNAGDIVGYNPWPAECVERVRDSQIPSVQGNHDRAVAQQTGFRFNRMAGAGVEHAQSELSKEQREWLQTLPQTRTAVDGRVKIVHGHPDDPDRYTYPENFSEKLLSDEEVLVMGHTHIQHAETYSSGVVVNPGSVGQPRDGNPKAAYAVVNLKTWDVELRRVKYDIEAVVDAVEKASLPRRIGSRLRRGE